MNRFKKILATSIFSLSLSACGGGGGSSSFGSYLSASGGQCGGNYQLGGCNGQSGTGSGGQFNSGPITANAYFGVHLGFGSSSFQRNPQAQASAQNAGGCGGGGKENQTGCQGCSGSGAPGIVIVEEFF